MYPGACNWTGPFPAVQRERDVGVWGVVLVVLLVMVMAVLVVGSACQPPPQSRSRCRAQDVLNLSPPPPQPFVLSQLPLCAALGSSAHWIMRSRRLITSCDGVP